MNSTKFCNRVIAICFYAVFFLVPLVFTNNTSELFELNKMWLTWGLTIVITVAWATKMTALRRFHMTRTPLDIPILLFLSSQIISTIFSLDTHVSLWGYYSRFNGGLYSTLTYILLYYAFVTNLRLSHVMKMIRTTLLAGIVVALWGLPSHFGYDPTCLLFRGSLDVSCWTAAFMPTIRIFSSLGQPAWFAAYMNILLPLTMAYFLQTFTAQKNIKGFGKISLKAIILLILVVLFYQDMLFADTRASTLAFFITDIILWALVLYKKLLPKVFVLRYFLVFHVLFLLLGFLIGYPIPQFDRYDMQGLVQHFSTPVQTAPSASAAKPAQTSPLYPQTVISDSGAIRLLVWKGAIKAWENNPIFGTGVETFAFAYYKYRPPQHNMTSEWDYLYNKAHNEYLNYLATTGIYGLGTYLLMIFMFFFLFLRHTLKKKTPEMPDNKHGMHENVKENKYTLFSIALIASYISILLTNFFGFSVVIINLYLFLIPAFVFLLENMLAPSENVKQEKPLQSGQWFLLLVYIIAGGYLITGLLNYWYADTNYALGMNLDQVGQYQPAYQYLRTAVSIEPNEPVYEDEYAVDLSALAAGLDLQKNTQLGSQLGQNAVSIDDQVVTGHPNDVVFWKDRVRILYTLSEGDTVHEGAYLQEALRSITIAHQLAPSDAKTTFNYGVLVAQNGNIQGGINILKQTISMKPDYSDAYIALGMLYHQQAINSNNKIINKDALNNAIATYSYYINHIAPGSPQMIQSLKSWEAQSK